MQYHAIPYNSYDPSYMGVQHEKIIFLVQKICSLAGRVRNMVGEDSPQFVKVHFSVSALGCLIDSVYSWTRWSQNASLPQTW